MKWINHILITAMVLVAVAMFANANIPPAPAELNNDTGNYWVNYTWSKELGDPVDDNVNVTDSFNVSMNGTWYNGTATFLNESVGPGGWANITVWAYNATGNGNMSVGGLSDSVQAPAMVDPPDDNPCTIMHHDSETRRKWIESYNAAPRVNISRDGVMYPDLPDNYSVLDRLDYNAIERDQGYCGNCWVWAGTGCMEVAHDAENDVFDRLSIQYLNSLYYDGNLAGAGHACCGGTLGKFTDFYSVNTTFAVPWNNANASWQDGSIRCSGNTTVSAASVATMPHYTTTRIEARTITTHNIGQTAAIDNIKSVLVNDSAVWFGFFLSNTSDWAVFRNFWNNNAETELWSPDYSCGHPWNPAEGGGHAVLCVGYNDSPDIEPYWIVLNSWGTANGNRSSGLFRMNMDINYNCSDDSGDPNLYWQMLDIDFADICVNETGWWRDGSVFHANATTPIQAAVDAAEDGETIRVAAGSYTENVHIETPHLTLVGEGADVVTVTAHGGSVFSVTADYVNISGFNVTGAWGAGIYLDGADYCNISDNNASNNNYGIYLYDSSDNTLTGNNASGNGYGIWLHSSSSNTLSNNTMSGNTYNFGVDGSSLSHYTQTIYSNNTVDGKPIYYWVGRQQGGQIPTDAGYVGVVSSTNITVRDLNLAKNFHGVLFVNTSDSTIENVTASGNEYGIYLHYSSNNTLTSNTASGNDYGIWLVDSSNDNTLTDNDALGNGCGIALDDSSNNTLTGNIANSNIAAPVLPAQGGSPGSGIWLGHSSNDNTLTSNNASGNGWAGIMLGAGVDMAEGVGNNTTSDNFGRRSPVSSNDTSDKGYGIGLGAGVEEMVGGASNNTLAGNTASGNEVGIALMYSSNYNILTDNDASGNGAAGIVQGDSNNNTLLGNIANSNIAAPVLPAKGGPRGSGIYLESSSSNTLSSNTASDNSDWDIYISNSPSNTFTDNTLNGTTVSFTYSGDVSLKGEGSPAADSSGWHNISKFINAMNHIAGAWLYLNFSYSDSDLTGTMVEPSLTVWKHNGTRWVKDGWDNGRYLDTAGNVVGVNITTFSVFAPMGVPPLHHINVTPTSKILGVNESQNFTATGYDQNGMGISDYFVFDWNRSDAYIGRFTEINDTATNFTAEHVGRAYITASNGSVASGQVQVTVDGGTNDTYVTNGAATVTSGDATVTCNLGGGVNGWINITAIGNATNSFEVNSSDPRYGLGDGDKAVSGVIVNVSGNITEAMAAGDTIRIRICYNDTTLAALGIDASTLAIWKYNSTTGWVKQPSTRSGTCVYVDVDHLCTYGLFGSKAAPTPSSDSSGGSGTYPPGWFGTPAPSVTATKASAATTNATAAPPGERVTPAPTKKTAAAKTDAPAAEGTTAKKSAPGFTAVFVIVGMLAVAYVLMRRRG